MLRNANTPVGDRGMRQGMGVENYSDTSMLLNSLDSHCSTPETSWYLACRRNYYEAFLNEALDDLAKIAVKLASAAGYASISHECSPEARDALRGMADGVRDRLIERCRAYEIVLRTTPVPERRGQRR